MKRPDITAERVRELFDYDQETGIFRWKLSPKGGIPAGHVAGTPDKHGYIMIISSQRKYKAHRLAWLYQYGAFPASHIDHIDGNKANNAIANLREATRGQNMQNVKKARKDSGSGLIGAYHRHDGKWWSYIRLNRVQIYLGSFQTPEAAHAAYLKAKAELHPFQTIVNQEPAELAGP